MNPESPAWLTQDHDFLRRNGFVPVTDSDSSGDQYASQTEAVGLEYLRLFLTDPDHALESIGDYFGRFKDINRSVGILSRLTPEQFGMIANIASLHYTTFDRDRLITLHSKLHDYLKGRNSASIPGLTAQIRKPELLRDLVAHWDVINWPSTGGYTRFLKGNTDWENVQQEIELRENNPVLFALTMPLDSTDPVAREHFRASYPELSHQGVDIIAAGLFNKGAHDEILRAEKGPSPDTAEWYRAHYKGWEDSIYESLLRYGAEYHPAILRAITEAGWNVFPEVEGITFQSLMEKITLTSFSLSEDGKLVRETH
ncbi:MAG: hypothetical protein HY426_03475 [Candidatus Levybacteria bacterium]|nr:hypothetical protein [Candidatus Levybacteria bacterium]